jgi:hypothetical protein
VHDGPVLEVRDHLLDHPSNLIDLGVVLFLPVEQFTPCGLPEGRDYVVSDVSFISDPVLWSIVSSTLDSSWQ